MALSEVLHWAQLLPRTEQLQLIQELAAGLQQSEGNFTAIEPGREYTVWSPISSYDAAAALLAALNDKESRS